MVFHTMKRKVKYPVLNLNNAIIERESKAIQLFRYYITLYSKIAET